ncbi:MAG: hypothetical protein VKO21_08005 [Candidatus Sericytochromatia bacterium]|nr:hypothetical protein [Candidatus Sericytochromatia bacterium]
MPRLSAVLGVLVPSLAGCNTSTLATGPAPAAPPAALEAPSAFSRRLAPRPGILDTTIPFDAGEPPYLHVLPPRSVTPLLLSQVGPGVEHPVAGAAGEPYVFFSRRGSILAWDALRSLVVLVDGLPGRTLLSRPSVNADGSAMLWHDPATLYLWQRIPKPREGRWELRGSSRRIPMAGRWATPLGGLAEAWGNDKLDRALLRSGNGRVALLDLSRRVLLTLRTDALGPVRSCSISPSGKLLLLATDQNLWVFEPDRQAIAGLPETNRALGQATLREATWITDEGFLATGRRSAQDRRFLLVRWPSERLLGAFAFNDVILPTFR